MTSFFARAALLVPLMASTWAAAEPPEAPFTREYTAEIVRHLYRWHLDETMLRTVHDYDNIELWVRPLEFELDENDKSQFLELLAPRIRVRVELKKSDYEVPELGYHIRNETFKIVRVDRYDEMPGDRADYHVVRFDRKEILDYLFLTRAERTYPDDKLQDRLRAAVREHLGSDAPTQADGLQTIYTAPLSPVSNHLWVFWENGGKIVQFSSDADMTTEAYWEYDDIGVEAFDLDEDVVVSMTEVGGSNAYITRDWASRVLFNCVVLGRKQVLTPPAASAP